MTLNKILISLVLLTIAGTANGAVTIYDNQSEYLAALADLGYTVTMEGFEDDLVWADSRSPLTTLSVISQGITWTSNQLTNQINTGTLGGSVIDGTYGFFSNPHGDDTDSGLYCDDAQEPIPYECWLNDGWIITATDGEVFYGVGGWFDSNTGGAKVTFLLDGVDINSNDTDNIDNWNRDGSVVSSWTFVGVIDTDGFVTAEILELSGKDYQQQFIFGDRFSIADNISNPANLPPVADAGPDQTAAPRARIMLDGSNSSDPDGSIQSYAWSYVSGGNRPPRFRNTSNSILTVQLPRVRTETIFIFDLAVTDNEGASATDTINVTVTP